MFEQIKTNGFEGCVVSLIGGRTENQDSYGFREFRDFVAFTVCDGMGGGPAGKLASSIAISAIMDNLQNTEGDTDLQEVARQAIASANTQVFHKACSDPSYNGMGSTCTLLIAGKNSAVAAHVGDSRIYHLHGTKIKYRTFDHSMVFELVRNKVITEEQARTSSQSNIITRALGIEESVEPEIHTLRYKEGDLFCLTTDGIHGTLPEKQLIQALARDDSDLAHNATVLTKRIDEEGIKAGGNHDNMTLMMVKATSDENKQGGLMASLRSVWSRLFAFVVMSAITLGAVGQTPYWAVAPSKTQWEHSHGAIFKRKALNMTQLYNVEKKVYLSSMLDSIADACNGYALGLKNEDGRLRVVSLINMEANSQLAITKMVYTTDFPFYSEGMVGVANSKGMEGYMNINGDIVIKCAYSHTHPFRDGKAMVTQKNDDGVKYIDNRGKNVSAVQRDEENVKVDIFEENTENADEGWSVFENNGKCGYTYHGDVVIPAQFDTAYDFYQGYAVVVKDGLYGIVGLNNSTLEGQFKMADKSFVYEMSLSEGLAPTMISAVATTDDGTSHDVAMEWDNENHNLLCKLDKEMSDKEFSLSLYYNDILARELLHERKYVKEEPKQVSEGKVYVASFGKRNKRADSNDLEYIVAKVANTTASAQTVRATIYVDGKPYSYSVKLKANKTATVTAPIKVKKEKFAKVYVRLSNGNKTKVRDIQLKPFY